MDITDIAKGYNTDIAKGSIIGFIDLPDTPSLKFFFEINQPFTEEEQKTLKQFNDDFVKLKNELNKKYVDIFEEYKTKVYQFLLKQDFIVKEIDLPNELEEIIHFLFHIEIENHQY